MDKNNVFTNYNENDDVYASIDLAKSMPKSTFPAKERNARNVFSAIRDELMLDGNSRQNLATFCQTWVDDEIRELMDLSIDKNMIDKDEYPQTAEIEARCVRMLANLWNSPTPETTLGCSTIGSSEAAMLGGLALKWQWRNKRTAKGLPTDKPNMICGPVQICWHKFARYFDVELREIPLEGDRLIMSPEEVLKRVDENTIGVVPTLGVTFTCQYEPVKQFVMHLISYKKIPAWISLCILTARAAASLLHSVRQNWSGISVCRESNLSILPAINLV